ncbi:hypothetical protein D9615_005020 [Tricholomella constricta]|uniref:Potassium channel domain-containing protein n=1 Tax=Tricholomella constricta TaxID=117010 RepID=A0A8H5HHL4_9AGAR|nr:hypothetical protein D9615_005020 [Tricholomella constricta]
MLLLWNIVYQFFFASRRTHSEPDPEKGPEQAHNQSDGEATDVSDTGNALTEDGHPTDDTADQENLPNDDNEIIEELEREEYPDSHPRRRKRRFTPFNTLSSIKGTPGLSSWWSRMKDVLDPRTSPADVEAYLPHYRYLPIFSGVIIPFSILLEIPGLTEDWYIRTEGHDIVDIRKNTPILDIGLAFSIAFAVFANVCLVVRFMEKKVKTMTIMCVVFLTIHDVINIIAVTVFGVAHRFNDGFTYGQAFWMTVCSTSVSSITNITLIVDLLRTPDFATSGSGLTRKQRTLVISVMALLTYMAFGGLVQTYLIGLTFLNALYFTVVSIETIGFGDIVPNSTGSRVFTCFYSIFGIVNLALTVGLTRETVLEAIEVGYRKRVKAMRQHRRAVQLERRVFERWRAAIEFRLRRTGAPIWVKDPPEKHQHRRCAWATHVLDKVLPWPDGEGSLSQYRYRHTVGHGHYPHPHGMHLNLEALTWPQLEAAAMEAGVPLRNLLPAGFKAKRAECKDGAVDHPAVVEKTPGHSKSQVAVPPELTRMPLTHARMGRMIVMLGNFALAVDQSSFVKVPKPGELAAAAKRKRERESAASEIDDGHRQRSVAEQYEVLRASMESEERRAFYVRLMVVWAVFFLFWMVGSAIFMATEKWTFGTALYFCFVAFTTIGYGDLTPKTPAGRSVFIFWALLGVGTMTILISILSEAYSSRYKSIFTSGIITQSVKRYQERARANKRRPLPTSTSLTVVPTRPPGTGITYAQPFSPTSPTTLTSPTSIDDALSDSRKRVDSQLEALPAKVLQHARTFGEEAHYLIEPEALDINKEAVPDGLRQLMDDVAGVERLGERIKDEILRDTDARHALLAISIENAFRKMMEIAEEAIEAVKERDRLTEMRSPTTEGVVQTGRDDAQPGTESALRHRPHPQQPVEDT